MVSKKDIPFISIITVTHNRSKLLERAIRSIQAQTYTNYEHIIIDCASKDDTRLLVRRFDDSRIRYFRQKLDKGLLAGKNQGYDVANGCVVVGLDDDDELVPNALEIVEEKFREAAKQGIYIIWFDCMDSEGKKTTGFGTSTEEIINYEDCLCERVGGEFWQVLDRTLLGRNRFDENLWGAEGNLWLKLYKKSKIWHIPLQLRIYHRDHPGNICKFENQLKKADKYVLNNKAFLKEFGNEQKKICPKAYARRLAVLGFWQTMLGYKKEGRLTLKDSLKLQLSTKPLLLYLASFFLGRDSLAWIYSKFNSIR